LDSFEKAKRENRFVKILWKFPFQLCRIVCFKFFYFNFRLA
jgi:hypothetical protein